MKFFTLYKGVKDHNEYWYGRLVIQTFLDDVVILYWPKTPKKPKVTKKKTKKLIRFYIPSDDLSWRVREDFDYWHSKYLTCMEIEVHFT